MENKSVEMKNNVYGVTIIKSINSNWNAGMDGNPKMLSMTGEILGSSNAEKYSIKSVFDMKGETVLGLGRNKIVEVKDKDGNEEEKIVSLDLGDTYKFLFDEEINKGNKKQCIINIVNNCKDVREFGVTFANKPLNFDLTGVVQFKEGVNLYKDTSIEEQSILSPYRNSNEKSAENEQRTMGTKIFTDKAHYCYSFSVIPRQLENFKKVYGIDEIELYNKEDYKLLKESMLINATVQNTCSKAGCDNELSLFIELKEGSLLTFPDLTQLLGFEKGEDKDVINIEKLAELVNSKRYQDNIKNIELYYDSLNLDIKGEMKNSKVLNIFTRDEVK